MHSLLFIVAASQFLENFPSKFQMGESLYASFTFKCIHPMHVILAPRCPAGTAVEYSVNLVNILPSLSTPDREFVQVVCG